MGKRGPRPMPTVLRMLNGNASKRALPKNEAKPKKAKKITAPKELTQRGRKIWNTLSKQLQTCGLLTIIDRNALFRYCDIFDKWLDAKRLYEEKGTFLPIYQGSGEKKKIIGFQRTPWSVDYRGFLRELLRLEGEFGMTPSARTRIQIDLEGDKKDELDNFLSKRAGG